MPRDLLRDLLAALAHDTGDDRGEWLDRARVAGRGLSGADRDAVEDAARLAETVHRRLVGLRRRERELTALFETARDLAAVRDREAVLGAIVRRARALLGTDATYMTLVDPARGDTEMQVTDGSVSARFQRVRLPLGAGLGGLVAATGMPYATANYFADKRFRHTEDIDDAVKDEGLVAILGVPVLLGRDVLGVLFAADRSERPFSPEEIALLGSLGALAAVAIDSARLLGETQQRLRELDTANETIRAQVASVERAANAHDRLAAVVLGGGDVDALARAVVGVLGGGLVVRDADGRVLASTGEAACSPDVLATVPVGARSNGRVHTEQDRSVVAAVAGDEVLGELVLSGRADLDDTERRIFERAAVVTALQLLAGRSAAQAEERVRGELLTDLLADPDRDPAGTRDRAHRLGVDLDAPYRVVVASTDGDRQRLAYATAHLARSADGLAAQHHDRAVLLLPGDQPAGELAERLAAELTSATQQTVTVGGSGPVAGRAGLPPAYAEADRCRAALLSLGRAGQGVSPAELGFVGLVLGDGHDPARFVRDVLGPVLDYDAARGTDLCETLRAYFAAGGSPTRARERLHVHANTVVQRLDRVTELLGEGWQQPERALEVQLALRLLDLTT